MPEANRINDQFLRAYQGEAWHGPSLKELLADVTPEQAARQPIADGHSIWELVGHIITWQRIVRQRVDGETVNDVSDELNFPAVTEATEANWQATLQVLDASTRALSERIKRVDDTQLKQIAPGKPYSIYFMLHGLVQHNLYHAGQIALLRKLR